MQPVAKKMSQWQKLMCCILLHCVVVSSVLTMKGYAAEPNNQSVYQLAEIAAFEVGLGKSEQLLAVSLDKNSDDDRARLQLGVVRFLRAVETFAAGLYQYGLKTNDSNVMFLRLPVEQNADPTEIDYTSFLRLLDQFRSNLLVAEQTLAGITDDEVKAPVRLAKIELRLGSERNAKLSLREVLEVARNRGLPLQAGNEELLVNFDRGDVAWLRAYCHLLSGIIDVLHAYETSFWFDQVSAGSVFPRVKLVRDVDDEAEPMRVRLADPIRLHRFRLHMLEVCWLNAETWRHIRSETDDDHEWLPNAKQTDLFGVPLSDQQIDIWLAVMRHLRGILQGQRLVQSNLLQYVVPGSPAGKGFSIAKFLDDPPSDLDWDRILADGIDPKYLEDENQRDVLDILLFLRLGSVFNGPFGVFSAVRLN